MVIASAAGTSCSLETGHLCRVCALGEKLYTSDFRVGGLFYRTIIVTEVAVTVSDDGSMSRCVLRRLALPRLAIMYT